MFATDAAVASGSAVRPQAVAAARGVRRTEPGRSSGWADALPQVAAELAAGQPFVTLVYVPLCSNAQIHCGGQGAGDPASPQKNLYWGRGFGVRRYFDETARGWKRLSRTGPEGPVLEEVIYSRDVDGQHFGLPAGRTIQQLLVLRAIHGAAIEAAVDAFYRTAGESGRVSVGEGAAQRLFRVQVVGYAGHNRLMDGYHLKTRPNGSGERSPIPAFVLACKSDPYFSAALREQGSTPLVMTRDLMAPEGYVIEAVVDALGENASRVELRRRVVHAYARWQKLSDKVASTIFAPSFAAPLN